MLRIRRSYLLAEDNFHGKNTKLNKYFYIRSFNLVLQKTLGYCANIINSNVKYLFQQNHNVYCILELKMINKSKFSILLNASKF